MKDLVVAIGNSNSRKSYEIINTTYGKEIIDKHTASWINESCVYMKNEQQNKQTKKQIFAISTDYQNYIKIQ